MGNSKQQNSALDSQVKSNRPAVEVVSNGKSNAKIKDDQLMDEAKKLDQIRDMLFGEHVATLQNDYQALGRSLDQNISILRKELAASIEELKKQIDQKFSLLQKSLQTEEAERLVQNEDLNSSLSTMNSDLMTKMDLEAKRMEQALHDQHHEATRQINSMVDSLQNAKVDRKSLAALFSQFAKELEGL